jgi:hypothetical protein
MYLEMMYNCSHRGICILGKMLELSKQVSSRPTQMLINNDWMPMKPSENELHEPESV